MEREITFLLLALGGLALFGMALTCMLAAVFKGAIMHLLTSSVYGLLGWRCFEAARGVYRETVAEKRRAR